MDIIRDIEGHVKSQRSEIWEVFAGTTARRRWVTMFGAPGSGKTTMLDKLAARHHDLRVSSSALAEVTDQRSRLRLYFEKAFGGLNEYFLHFQMEMLIKRIEQSLNAAHAGGVVDGSICSTLAYSRALLETDRLTADEYSTFYSWYLAARTVVGYPSHVIYCCCSTPELVRRVDARSRPHEVRRYSLEYMDALNAAFASIADEYREHAQVIVVDTQQNELPCPEEEKEVVDACCMRQIRSV